MVLIGITPARMIVVTVIASTRIGVISVVTIAIVIIAVTAIAVIPIATAAISVIAVTAVPIRAVPKEPPGTGSSITRTIIRTISVTAA